MLKSNASEIHFDRHIQLSIKGYERLRLNNSITPLHGSPGITLITGKIYLTSVIEKKNSVAIGRHCYITIGKQVVKLLHQRESQTF